MKQGARSLTDLQWFFLAGTPKLGLVPGSLLQIKRFSFRKHSRLSGINPALSIAPDEIFVATQTIVNCRGWVIFSEMPSPFKFI